MMGNLLQKQRNSHPDIRLKIPNSSLYNPADRLLETQSLQPGKFRLFITKFENFLKPFRKLRLTGPC